MKSAGPGPGTFPVELGEVSVDSFVVNLGNEVLRVAYADFPWFRGVAIADLKNLERPSPDHLYWPSLDIDLAVESVRHPERFPLVSGVDAVRS